jgi:hypothetical protein
MNSVEEAGVWILRIGDCFKRSRAMLQISSGDDGLAMRNSFMRKTGTGF